MLWEEETNHSGLGVKYLGSRRNQQDSKKIEFCFFILDKKAFEVFKREHYLPDARNLKNGSIVNVRALCKKLKILRGIIKDYGETYGTDSK